MGANVMSANDLPNEDQVGPVLDLLDRVVSTVEDWSRPGQAFQSSSSADPCRFWPANVLQTVCDQDGSMDGGVADDVSLRDPKATTNASSPWNSATSEAVSTTKDLVSRNVGSASSDDDGSESKAPVESSNNAAEQNDVAGSSEEFQETGSDSLVDASTVARQAVILQRALLPTITEEVFEDASDDLEDSRSTDTQDDDLLDDLEAEVERMDIDFDDDEDQPEDAGHRPQMDFLRRLALFFPPHDLLADPQGSGDHAQLEEEDFDEVDELD